MTQKELDPEIAKRLKYNLGSIDEFLDQKELARILAEQTSIDDMYIISRIDKSGNLGSSLASRRARSQQDGQARQRPEQVSSTHAA